MRKMIFAMMLVTVLLGSMASGAPARAQTPNAFSWYTEMVDSMSDVGRYNSLALDGAGRAHIAYYAADTGNLKYAYHDGAAWQIETVDRDDLRNKYSYLRPRSLLQFNVGKYPALALDGAGRAHIAYYAADTGDLKYARYYDGRWYAEVVDTAGDVGWYPDLRLDGARQPHIGYYDQTNGAVKFAYYDGMQWQIETIETVGDVGEHIALVVSNYDVHVCYQPAGAGVLICDGLIVDTAGGLYPAAAVDSAARLHVSYYDADGGDLKYARYDGAAWQIEVVDSAGDVGIYPALALDGAERPHISYYDQTNATLKYAYYDGVRWDTDTVTFVGEPPGDSALAVDWAGLPRISCYAGAARALYYAQPGAPPPQSPAMTPFGVMVAAGALVWFMARRWA